jgi:hypothetical protein
MLTGMTADGRVTSLDQHGNVSWSAPADIAKPMPRATGAGVGITAGSDREIWGTDAYRPKA